MDWLSKSLRRLVGTRPDVFVVVAAPAGAFRASALAERRHIRAEHLPDGVVFFDARNRPRRHEGHADARWACGAPAAVDAGGVSFQVQAAVSRGRLGSLGGFCRPVSIHSIQINVDVLI